MRITAVGEVNSGILGFGPVSSDRTGVQHRSYGVPSTHWYEVEDDYVNH